MKRLLRLFKHFTITGSDGTPYLRRYYLLKTRWFSIYLHEIMRDDEDDLHDHPWDFTSVILSGGYFEQTEVNGQNVWHPPFSVIRHKAEDKHKLSLFFEERYCETRRLIPCWTLVFVGKKRREWGFYTANGWVHWENYMDHKFGNGKWTSDKMP